MESSGLRDTGRKPARVRAEERGPRGRRASAAARGAGACRVNGHRLVGRLAAGALALSIAGCVTYQGRLPPLTDWAERRAVLADWAEWRAAGRIGVRAGDEGFSAGFDWRQEDERLAASVRGPLGVGGVRLTGTPAELTVVRGRDEPLVLTDPEVELRARLGWTIPVGSLRYWLLGIPDPAAPAQTRFTPGGELAELVQHGWTVRYTSYAPAAGALMPRRLSAARDDLSLKVLVKQWEFARPPRDVALR